MAKKKTVKRRRPAKRGVAKTRKITRRRRNPSHALKRRRRRNPSGGGGGLNAVTNEMRKAIPRLLGMMATAWAVRRWGGHSGLFGPSFTSPMLGQSWGWQQYGVALAVAWWGPRFASKIRIDSTEFRRGSVDLIMQKLLWTEGFARSPWAQKQFGTGDIGLNSANNQAYVDQGGRWTAMQGLVEASPLDGLVEASPLDGDLDYSYGHLLPSGTPTSEANSGRYTGSGYSSPFHAAFNRG